MIQVEQQFDRSYPAIHPNGLAANHGREGGKPLLAIEKELGLGIRIGLLPDRKGLLGDWLIGFPDQDGA